MWLLGLFQEIDASVICVKCTDIRAIRVFFKTREIKKNAAALWVHHTKTNVIILLYLIMKFLWVLLITLQVFLICCLIIMFMGLIRNM